MKKKKTTRMIFFFYSSKIAIEPLCCFCAASVLLLCCFCAASFGLCCFFSGCAGSLGPVLLCWGCAGAVMGRGHLFSLFLRSTNSALPVFRTFFLRLTIFFPKQPREPRDHPCVREKSTTSLLCIQPLEVSEVKLLRIAHFRISQ